MEKRPGMAHFLKKRSIKIFLHVTMRRLPYELMESCLPDASRHWHGTSRVERKPAAPSCDG